MQIANLRRFLAPALACLVLGLALTLLMRTRTKVEKTRQTGRLAEESVADFLRVTRERDQLQAELARLQTTMAQKDAESQIREELERELASTGLLPVRGPGVTVIIDSTTRASGSTRRVEVADILLVLNELRASGAEAIAVNGIRVTSQFAIARHGGSDGLITANDSPIPGVVLIDAIGDPTLLIASLNLRGGILQQLQPWLQVSMVEAQQLTVPPSVSAPTYHYARPKR